MTATADLSLNTLAHFLDRFVYKNPKKPKPKGASAMQPAASAAEGASGVKLLKGEVTDGAPPVNDEKWWRRRVEDVPVDQVSGHVSDSTCGILTTVCVIGLLPQILCPKGRKGAQDEGEGQETQGRRRRRRITV